MAARKERQVKIVLGVDRVCVVNGIQEAGDVITVGKSEADRLIAKGRAKLYKAGS